MALVNPFSHEARFDEHLVSYRRRADTVAAGTNCFLLLVCLALAPIEGTFVELGLVGLPTAVLSVLVARNWSGQLIGRLYNAAAFMVFTGLVIHQLAGDIEAHFVAFGLVAILLYYRDWRAILTATITVYAHHLVLGLAQTRGAPIYVFDASNFWTLFLTHVAYFLPFVTMMGYLSIWLRREGYAAEEVIQLAEQIVHGDLTAGSNHDPDGPPLIVAVSAMKQRLTDLVTISPVATAIVRQDDGAIVSVNRAWERTLGPLPEHVSLIEQAPIWSDPDSWTELLNQLGASESGYLSEVELPLRTNTGTSLLCELSMVRLDSMDPEMVIGTFDDITARRRAEDTMLALAFHDGLTGLPNRAQLHDRLGEAIARHQRSGAAFALAIIDLDDFKPVNDTYGHDAGDEVLRVVARRLENRSRRSDFVARLGGDEFAVILDGCSDHDRSRSAAADLVEAVALPIGIGRDRTVTVGASVGIAMMESHHSTVDELIKAADTAMYRDKRAGNDTRHLADADPT